jgi:hypothetical protein
MASGRIIAEAGDVYNHGVSTNEVGVANKLILTAILCITLCGATFYARSAAQIGSQGRSQAEQEMLDRQVREANKKRQQDIRDETEKLFQLSSELKAAVEKSNEHVLSLDVVRKAEEVEKLAKKVKEKMKEAIGPVKNMELPGNSIPGRPPQ